MRFSILAMIGFVTLTSEAAAEIIPGSQFSFGAWNGAAFTDDNTKAFSHCSMQASFQSGDTLFFSVNANATVSVAVQSRGLTLVPGQTFPVTLYVDNRRPMFGSAQAIDATLAILTLDDFEAAMIAFQKGQTLVVESTMGRGTYDLTGTFRALDQAMNCAVRFMDVTGGAINPPVSSQVTEIDMTLLFQIATEMITLTGATGFRYLTKEELSNFVTGDDAVYWTSEQDGLLGGVQIVPLGDGQDLRSSDAGDIAFAGGGCAGELATSTRNLTADGYEAREIRALCIADGKETEALVTKTLVGSYVLYTVLMFSDMGADVGTESRQTLSEDVAIRAASFVREAAPAN